MSHHSAIAAHCKVASAKAASLLRLGPAGSAARVFLGKRPMAHVYHISLGKFGDSVVLDAVGFAVLEFLL